MKPGSLLEPKFIYCRFQFIMYQFFIVSLPPILAQKRQLQMHFFPIFLKFSKQYFSLASPQSSDKSSQSSRDIFATTKTKRTSVVNKYRQCFNDDKFRHQIKSYQLSHCHFMYHLFICLWRLIVSLTNIMETTTIGKLRGFNFERNCVLRRWESETLK